MKTTSLATLQSKIGLDRASVDKFVLYLSTMCEGDRIKTKLFEIEKTSTDSFRFQTTRNATQRLIDSWVLDKSSALDLVLGEFPDD